MASKRSGLGRFRNALNWSRSSSSHSSRDSEAEEEFHVPTGSEIQQLHFPKSPEALMKVIVGNPGLDLNAIEPSLQRAPLHSILLGNRPERTNLLEVLFTYGNVNPNLQDLDGMFPLHLAIKNNDIPSMKLLIAFGADVNAVNADNLTPTELSKIKTPRVYFKRLKSWTGISVDVGDSDVMGFTIVHPVVKSSLGTLEEDSPTHDAIIKKSTSGSHSLPTADSALQDPLPMDIVSNMEESTESSVEEVESEVAQFLRSVGGIVRNENSTPGEFEPAVVGPSEDCYNDNSYSRRLYKQLDEESKRQLQIVDLSSLSSSSIDAALASTEQRIQVAKFRKTGSRILCMDGGGMKAVVELDILESIERETGRKITELFDWIVGTSTGGILALGLVYGKKSIQELRQLCFQLKDEVFQNPKFGMVYDSAALEKMLMEALGTETRMGDIKHPKVMVAATHKGSLPLQIHLFNNCFDDNLSNEVVWKVARSTCAGPILFSEFNNYVDGGVLCNNPTETGVTTIQNYHSDKGEKLPISLIVSVGSGAYPDEKLGSVDLKMKSFKHRAANLLDLFKDALLESETVADTCDRNFKEQGIPYYRFSPMLTESISAGETDSKKLIDTVITTRQQTFRKIKKMVSTHMYTS